MAGSGRLPTWEPLLGGSRPSGLPPAPARGLVPGVRTAVELPLLLLVAMLIALGLRSFVGQAFVIPSGSMFPQLEVGDRVLVSKTAYDLHDFNRGDVIVFESLDGVPPDRSILPVRLVKRTLEAVGARQPPGTDFIKRIVALPGEVVQGRDGRVYIDGKLLEEPYLPGGVVTGDFGPELVPRDHLWVMGDNRGNSLDSRDPSRGPVPIEQVVGRAVLRVWPPGRWAFL
ncbi:MAG TPA: signal peptidase I [Acidimicrobiales bacterium]